MKYFIIAGEASGDTHAATLIRALQQCDKDAQMMGLGGDRMTEAGCRLFQDYRHMAFMGFEAVLRNLSAIRENFRITYDALLAERPDVLILIDYPTFNLKIAKFVRQYLPNTKIVYYIPPKAWAWKRWRVHQIAQRSDLVLGIFPFEPAFYEHYGYHCTYVGNPTEEAVRIWREAHPQPEREHTIVILPGSRPSEVSHCLPTMLTAARRFTDYHIVVTAAPGLDDAFYASYLHEGETLTRDTYDAVSRAAVAVVNSGTATLETALLSTPQVAVYHIALPHMAGLVWKAVFTIRHFTLVNIIPNREIIRELLAYLFTADNVETELRRLLTDHAYTAEMLNGYNEVQQLLGTNNAAEKAAALITSFLKK